MKIRFILIMNSLLALNIPCQGMERDFPLKAADLKHPGVREGVQLLDEKLGDLKTNQKLTTGHLSQKVHKVHTAVDKVHETVHGVDSKVERLSGTLEDGSEVTTAAMETIEAQLKVLNEHAIALNKQTSAIHAEIMRVSAELTALKYLVTPLNMATSNPEVRTAVLTPRETVPLGNSPRIPAEAPTDLETPFSQKSSPLNKGHASNPTRVSSLKTLQPKAQPSKKKKKKKHSRKEAIPRSKSHRTHDKKEKKKGS